MRVLFLSLFVLMAAMATFGQKNVVSPSENATLEETSKWLVSNFVKYSKYTTPGREFSVSNAKFASCKLNYTEITRFGSTSYAVMGSTVTRTNSKRDLTIDLTTVDPTKIETADHLLPDLRYIRLAKRSAGLSPIELVVKAEAANALRSAFARGATLCSKPN
jgi:hypothetical protein